MNMKKGNKKLIISLVFVALLYAAGCLVEHTAGTKSMVVTVLQKGAVYALIAVSMNLLKLFKVFFNAGSAMAAPIFERRVLINPFLITEINVEATPS